MIMSFINNIRIKAKKMENINLGKFKTINIIEKEVDYNYKCDFCSREVYRVGIFDICNHHCCTECIDNLYDNDNPDIEDSFLFLCPLCRKYVKDIEYR